MDVLLKYARQTGIIWGVYHSSVTGFLDAQIVPDDPDYGYLKIDTPLDSDSLHRGYYMADGALTVRGLLTLTASPNPFPADGVTACAVTVSPFVPCTLVVEGISQELTPEDQTLELTSDVPHTFHVDLQTLAPYWANPLRVEAQ